MVFFSFFVYRGIVTDVSLVRSTSFDTLLDLSTKRITTKRTSCSMIGSSDAAAAEAENPRRDVLSEAAAAAAAAVIVVVDEEEEEEEEHAAAAVDIICCWLASRRAAATRASELSAMALKGGKGERCREGEKRKAEQKKKKKQALSLFALFSFFSLLSRRCVIIIFFSFSRSFSHRLIEKKYNAIESCSRLASPASRLSLFSLFSLLKPNLSSLL